MNKWMLGLVVVAVAMAAGFASPPTEDSTTKEPESKYRISVKCAGPVWHSDEATLLEILTGNYLPAEELPLLARHFDYVRYPHQVLEAEEVLRKMELGRMVDAARELVEDHEPAAPKKKDTEADEGVCYRGEVGVVITVGEVQSSLGLECTLSADYGEWTRVCADLSDLMGEMEETIVDQARTRVAKALNCPDWKTVKQKFGDEVTETISRSYVQVSDVNPEPEKKKPAKNSDD